MKKAVFAGTFDPFTIGHYDLVKRAAEVFDEVIVGVAGNGSKKKCVASIEQRAKIASMSMFDIKNVSVKVFDGLLTDFASENGAKYLVRGIRNGVDFEYEKNLMAVYQATNPEIEIFYLISQPTLSFVSSSFIKDLKFLNGEIDKYVCANALELIKEIY
ncbi:MAG: pantetheine-phosphate adenylyltransferase [Clostridiales bacterium]|nr:pantetheine-phosphate adenylyltransferase [Clostridiales bacterium]